jgi:hypothetical protein
MRSFCITPATAWVLAAFALLFQARPAGADSVNLVLNGGFETGSLAGWTQTGNTSGTDAGGVPHSGIYAARMGPVDTDGHLSQEIATTAGTTYDVSFWVESPKSYPNQPNNSFSVEFAGVTFASGTDLPETGYTQYSAAITATGDTSLLQITARNNPAHFYFDDVSVVAQDSATTAAVPLPSSARGGLVLLGSLTGWAALRRRNSAVPSGDL